MNPATLTTSTFTLIKQGTSTPLAASVSYASHVARRSTRAQISRQRPRYTATVKGGASGAKDIAGNALAADVSWSFTTSAGGPQPPPTGTSYLSDLTWTSMVNHCGPVEKDRSNGICGAGDGRDLALNGITFAKGLGAHADLGRQLLSWGAARASRPRSAWTTRSRLEGSLTFRVYSDTTLVFDSGAMNAASATQTIDVSVQGGQLWLVVDQAAQPDWDHADWALARVECGGGGDDTTPPTITGHDPPSTVQQGSRSTSRRPRPSRRR